MDKSWYMNAVKAWLAATVEKANDALLEAALATGGYDNITLSLLQFSGKPQSGGMLRHLFSPSRG